MGAVCCCLCTGTFEDYINQNSSLHRNCISLNCFVQNLLNMYTSLFRRNEVLAISSTNQGATSVISTTSPDHSLPRADTYRSLARPLPFDTDPRFLRDGLVRREKGSSHLHEETIPLRSDTDMDSESLSNGEKWNGSICEEGLKEHHSKACMKLSSAKTVDGIGFIYSSSDDEDVCPTCLEEYSFENPKIITKCSHHFHLACIYEWMERSDSCPVCGKVMAFDESDALT